MIAPFRWMLWTLVALALATVARAQTPRPPRFLLARTGTGPFVPIDVARTATLHRRIALDLQNAPPGAALDTIARRAGFALVYRQELLPSGLVNLHTDGITVAAALTEVLLDADVDVVLRPDGAMTLVRRLPIAPDTTTHTVTGVVRDSANGEPVAGVNVLLKGTKAGTVTDAEGAYRLRVPKVDGVLVFFRIGYRPLEVGVAASATTVNAKLAQAPATLSAVQVNASTRQQPVEHTSDLAVVQEIKQSASVVSGIASEQIAKSADINAAQIVRHIAGVTVTDESFLVVRGMNPRYNATYLDDNLAPSTELYSRAFDLSLLPDRIVDKILVYKSPRPDLIGDMTGAAVKVYTKDALAIRRFDLSLRVGDRAISTGKDLLSYSGGKTDWLGIDDGTRALPSVVPPYGSFQHATLSQSQYLSAFSPVLGPKTITASPDFQATANYYDNWKLGSSAALYDVTSASYTYETRSNGIDEQEGQSQNPSTNPNQSNAYQGYNNWLEHDQRGTQKANLNLMQNMTLRLGDATQIYFKNFVLQQGTSTTIDQIRSPNDSVLPSVGSGMYGTWTRNIVLEWEQRFLYQGNLGGTHDFARNQSLAWNAGLTSTLHSIPDQRTARFENSNEYLNDQPYNNSVESFNTNWTAIDRSNQTVGGPFDQTGTIARTWTRNAEQIYNGSLDYTVSPADWMDLKFGSYAFFKTRTVDRREYTVFDGEMALLGSGAVMDPNGGYTPPGTSRYVNDGLIHFRPQDLNNIWSSRYFPNDMTGLAVVDNTTPTDAYEANEVYDAGYVMTTLKPFAGRVELNGGVRVEYDQVRLAAAQYANGAFFSSSPALPLLIHRQTTSWLPSVNLAIRSTPWLVIRAAYGKTVNRPEFREISPFADYNYEDNTLVSGNPEVVQSSIDNYDLRVELYPGNGNEQLSIGAFYKNMTDPIERRDYYVTNTFSGILFPETISYGNSPRARVKGLETDVRKGLFWNLSLVASGAVIDSRVSPSPDDAIPSTFRSLQGQAPYVVDAGLFYDNPRIGTRVSATYTESGVSMYAVGATVNGKASGNQLDYRGSIFQLPQGLLEAAITQTVGSAWRFKLSAQNLLNEAIRFAQDETLSGKYEPEHLANVVTTSNGNTTQEREYVGDNISRRFNPGQYFLFTVTRSF